MTWRLDFEHEERDDDREGAVAEYLDSCGLFVVLHSHPLSASEAAARGWRSDAPIDLFGFSWLRRASSLVD